MSPVTTALILICTSALGCTIGRFAGKPLKICPYVLSAMISAVLPILVGIALGAEAAMVGLGCGAGGAVGTYLSGHRSKVLAVTGAVLGSAILSVVVVLLMK